MAWNAWLIDEDKDPSVIEGIYFNDLADYNSYDIYQGGQYIGKGYELSGVKPHAQRMVVTSSGKIDEYLLSLGANFNHKVYIGGSMGLLNLDYQSISNFSETDDKNLSDVFGSYNQRTEYSVKGMGINFKAGVIIRPIRSLRLGAAVHTPNFFSLTHDRDKFIDSYFDKPVGSENPKTQYRVENGQLFDYRLETPFKAVLSAAYTLGSAAILSIDYDYINYSSMKFRHSGDGYDYTGKNNEIQSYMRSTGDLRAGAEVRITPNFSLRGGYGIYGNPWKKTVKIDGNDYTIANSNDSFSNYSFGFGYREKHFFVDFAYRITSTEESFKVYEMSVNSIEPSGANIAMLKGLNNQATLTLGFRF